MGRGPRRGHFSPSSFKYITIPRFKCIAIRGRVYGSPSRTPGPEPLLVGSRSIPPRRVAQPPSNQPNAPAVRGRPNGRGSSIVCRPPRSASEWRWRLEVQPWQQLQRDITLHTVLERRRRPGQQHRSYRQRTLILALVENLPVPTAPGPLWCGVTGQVFRTAELGESNHR